VFSLGIDLLWKILFFDKRFKFHMKNKPKVVISVNNLSNPKVSNETVNYYFYLTICGCSIFE
jgi:hypothetical protein